MGHSFLYAQNYMFSRNAIFYKVTKKAQILLQGNKFGFDDIQTISSFAKSINNDPHCYTIETISSCAFLQNLFSINSVQMGLYTETGMAMMALREAPYY